MGKNNVTPITVNHHCPPYTLLGLHEFDTQLYFFCPPWTETAAIGSCLCPQCSFPPGCCHLPHETFYPRSSWTLFLFEYSKHVWHELLIYRARHQNSFNVTSRLDVKFPNKRIFDFILTRWIPLILAVFPCFLGREGGGRGLFWTPDSASSAERVELAG